MPILQYLDASSTQTLLGGIRELRCAEGSEGDVAQSFASELLNDIDSHDAIHVLFGCPTNLAGEIIAHVWTMLATDISLKDMHRVNSHYDHRSVLKDIGHAHLIKTWIGSLPVIARTILRTMRMKRRFPASRFTEFLDRRLIDLRQEYGIQIQRIPSTQGTSSGAALRNRVLATTSAPHRAS